MRILVNGIHPLVKETMIDYASGEESPLTLEYEGLKNHCSVCHRLSHLATDCPSISAMTETSPLVPPARPYYAPTEALSQNSARDSLQDRSDKRVAPSRVPARDRLQERQERSQDVTGYHEAQRSVEQQNLHIDT